MFRRVNMNKIVKDKGISENEELGNCTPVLVIPVCRRMLELNCYYLQIKTCWNASNKGEKKKSDRYHSATKNTLHDSVSFLWQGNMLCGEGRSSRCDILTCVRVLMLLDFTFWQMTLEGTVQNTLWITPARNLFAEVNYQWFIIETEVCSGYWYSIFSISTL